MIEKYTVMHQNFDNQKYSAKPKQVLAEKLHLIIASPIMHFSVPPLF